MKNPITALKDELESMRRELRRKVLTDVYQEMTRTTLSRLLTIDPDQAATYQRMLDELKEL